MTARLLIGIVTIDYVSFSFDSDIKDATSALDIFKKKFGLFGKSLSQWGELRSKWNKEIDTIAADSGVDAKDKKATRKAKKEAKNQVGSLYSYARKQRTENEVTSKFFVTKKSIQPFMQSGWFENFDDKKALATEYFNTTDYFAKLTEENKGAYITQLKGWGVQNADEIVYKAAKDRKEALAASDEFLAEKSKEVGEATANEIHQFALARGYTEGVTAALDKLALKKQLINGTELDFTRILSAATSPSKSTLFTVNPYPDAAALSFKSFITSSA